MAYAQYGTEEKAIGYIAALVYSIVVAMLWGPAFLARRFVRFVRETGTENWPRANGSITTGRVRVIRGWILDYAIGELDYNYTVRGEYYSGHLSRQFADEQAAWSFVDSVSGKSVVARYKDQNVSSSALREDDQEPSWLKQAAPGFLVQLQQHWADENQTDPFA